MTTQVTTTVIDHSTDAGFRTWVAELITMCTAAGLVQTADTGQINTATVVRAAVNADAGYAIFRFNDTQQGTSPIFMRFDFGTGNPASMPRLKVAVGTGSNGSGTLTGVGIVSTVMSNNTTPNAATTWVTRVCVVDGFFGLMWKLGAATFAYGFCAIARSVDVNGDPTAEGAAIYSQAAAVVACTVARYLVPSAVALATGSYSLVHGGHATSLVGGAAQVFKHYMTLPKVAPNAFLLTVISSELGNNTTFTAKPVGATSRTFVSSGVDGVRNVGSPTGIGTQVMAMIWE